MVLGTLIFMTGNPVSAVLSSLSLGATNIMVCYVNNSSNFTGNQPMSSGSWNAEITQINEALVSRYMTPCPASQRQRKIRRHKRPCAYYSNPTATFHALLVGDLVFKLNPGPTVNCAPAVVSTRSDQQQIAQLSRPSRNLRNLININFSIHID